MKKYVNLTIFLIGGIFTFIGLIFFLISVFMGNHSKEIKETGEYVEAYVIETHYAEDENDSSYTILEITDRNSQYETETITINAYYSSIESNSYINIWYNGEDGLLPGSDTFIKVFKIIGLSFLGLGLLFVIGRIFIILVKILLTSIGIAALYSESKRQEELDKYNNINNSQ